MKDYYWQKNLEIIEKYRPDLIKFLDEVRDEKQVITTKRTKNGNINFYYNVTPIYSEVNSYRQAEEVIENSKKDLKKGVILIFGFGGGYLVEKILDYVDKSTIVITVDPDVLFLKEVLKSRDLRKVMKAPNLVIGVLNNDTRNLSPLLVPYMETILSKGIGIFFDPSIYRYRISFYKKAKEELVEYMRYLSIHFNTFSVLGFAFIVNTFFNLPRYIFNPGIQILKNKFKNVPAIIVSAGPSLDKNIDLLKYAKSKALIIAIGPTFKPLINRNIIPDFVVAIDPVDTQVKMFRGREEETKSSILITFPYFNYKALRLWKGKIMWIGGKDPLISYIDKISENFHDYIETGMTVAHTAFLFADYIGANPLILMGQDLSFSSEKTHVSDAPHVKRAKLDPNSAIWVKGNYEEKVPTNRSFASFIYLFNAYVDTLAKKGKYVINATEGGAFIEGTKVLKFREVLDSLLLDKIDITLKEEIPEFVNINLEKFENSVNEIVLDLERIMQHTFNLLKEVKNLKETASKNEIDALNKRILQVQKQIIENNAFDIIRKFVEVYERKKRNREERIREKVVKGEKDIRYEIDLQKKKSITYYSEIYTIAKFYRDMFVFSKEKTIDFYKSIKDKII